MGSWIVPTPTPAGGGASVSLTVPAGTPNGAHTVYAIGSRGDVASAAITVAVPTAITTTAWDLRAASSGSESNQSDAVSFADGRLRTTSSVLSSFNAGRYLQFDYSPSLDGTRSVSSAGFSFRFAANASGNTSCFYFDVRRTSTGSVLATHGSSSSPVGCVTGTTQQTFTTMTPAVASAAIANDLSVRVFLRDSASGAVRVDMGTLAGNTPQPLSFTLFESRLVDSTSGTATTAPWPLIAADSTVYTSAANWTTSFSTSRYLRLSFPAYVPAGSTVSSASFRHSYRSNTTGTTCWYFALYSGSTVIGTHGSSSSPIRAAMNAPFVLGVPRKRLEAIAECESHGDPRATAYVTDTVALPELTTAAQANGASVRIYVNNSSSLRSRDDVDTLSLSYLGP